MLTIRLTASTLDDLSAQISAYQIEFDPYVWGTAVSQQGRDQNEGVYFAIITRSDTTK